MSQEITMIVGVDSLNELEVDVVNGKVYKEEPLPCGGLGTHRVQVSSVWMLGSKVTIRQVVWWKVTGESLEAREIRKVNKREGDGIDNLVRHCVRSIEQAKKRVAGQDNRVFNRGTGRKPDSEVTRREKLEAWMSLVDSYVEQKNITMLEMHIKLYRRYRKERYQPYIDYGLKGLEQLKSKEDRARELYMKKRERRIERAKLKKEQANETT